MIRAKRKEKFLNLDLLHKLSCEGKPDEKYLCGERIALGWIDMGENPEEVREAVQFIRAEE